MVFFLERLHRSAFVQKTNPIDSLRIGSEYILSQSACLKFPANLLLMNISLRPRVRTSDERQLLSRNFEVVGNESKHKVHGQLTATIDASLKKREDKNVIVNHLSIDSSSKHASKSLHDRVNAPKSVTADTRAQLKTLIN